MISAQSSRLAFVFLALLASGCVTETRSILPTNEAELRANEGILVVHVSTDKPIGYIDFERSALHGRASGPLSVGEHVQLISIEAGRYNWSEIEVAVGRRYGRRLTYSFRPHYELSFEVKPGVINYPGMLSIRGTGWKGMGRKDRSASAMRHLQEHYSSLLSRYPLVYSGPGWSVFLHLYKQQQRQLQREAPPLAEGSEP